MNLRLLLTILTIATASLQAANKVGPWDLSVLHQTPRWEPTDLAPQPGMQGILYHSLPYKGQPVQVFAYYSAPQGQAPEGGWPAVVCIHGGGGTAYHTWVRKWNAHGYAAIAMDLEGHLPLKQSGKKGRQPTPNPGPSRLGVFKDFDRPIEQQWYYHAVAQVICAHSLIRSFPEVNPHKTGMTGISWGGNLTASTMGVDTRFKFAIPGYGCGFLSDSSGHQGRAIESAAHTALVDQYYDGKAYFHNVTYPTLWVNGTNDFHFDMPAFQKSSSAVQGPATMRFELEMLHSHPPVWDLEECYVFADSVVKDGTPLASIGVPMANGTQASAPYTSAVPITQATLLYTTDTTGVWPDKKWRSKPAAVQPGRVSAELPAGTQAFLFTLTDERNLMASSHFLEHSVAGGAPAEPQDSQDAAEIDYAALYRSAAKPADHSQIIIADDFEDDLSAAITDLLECVDPLGVAGIDEWYDNVASGGKSLKLTNSRSVKHGHHPCLSKWFRGAQTLTKGTLTIAFDTLIPSEGGSPLMVAIRDYSAQPAVNLLDMGCTPQGVRINKQTSSNARDQWVHYQISLPIGRPNAAATVQISDPTHGQRTVQASLPAAGASAVSWVGLYLNGKSEGAAYIDNLIIKLEP